MQLVASTQVPEFLQIFDTCILQKKFFSLVVWPPKIAPQKLYINPIYINPTIDQQRCCSIVHVHYYSTVNCSDLATKESRLQATAMICLLKKH